MRNLVVDVVFWGVGITDNDRAEVREYVQLFAGHMNGLAVPPGQEPAVHNYGLSGLVPGAWINDPNPFPAGVARGECCSLNEALFVDQIQLAHNGAFGPAFDFSGNIVGSALPSGATRVALVITKGTNNFAQTRHLFLSHPQPASGFHDNDGTPWAASMFDPGGAGTNSFPVVVSHELLETMTDVAISSGWATNEGFLGLSHAEIADQCGGAGAAPQWIASTGGNISGISAITLDQPFGGINNIPQNSCQLYEPEEYAPLAATLEPNRAGVFLDLFYRTPAGRIGQLTWTTPSASAGGPLDWGQPQVGSGSLHLPSIIAQGKPSAVPGFGPGATLVFVRGSDNALWMLSAPQGQWTSLGGQFFGDPNAVSRGGIVHVFVLGLDDRVYSKVITNGVPSGWIAVTPVGLVGVPRAFSRDQNTIDLFVTGENAFLDWFSFSSSLGWSPLSGDASMSGFLHFKPIGISSWGANRLDIAVNTSGIRHRLWNGSWGASEAITPLGGGIGTPGIASWGVGRLDVFVNNTQNQLMHAYRVSDTDQWHGDVNNPMRTDVVGDPVVVSRGQNELDIFYRTTAGSLTHLNFNSGWTVEPNILPTGSIQ